MSELKLIFQFDRNKQLTVMTNTLHENGHWVGENKLDLVESSTSDQNATMERTNHSSSTSNIAVNEQETNGTNDNEELIEDDGSVVESANEESEEEVHHSSVPYTYTGHLGTTAPQVLRHIDEAIDQVVKHFQVSKADLLESNSLLATNSSSSSHHHHHHHHQNSSKTTKSTKVKRKKKKKTNNYSFEIDHPFELPSSTANKKKQADAKRRENFGGPFIRVERKKNQTNYIVVNSSSKLEDKDNKLFNKPNYGSIAKSKSSNQMLFQNDSTWVCVFCKRQPHYKELGDLFGPHEVIEKTVFDSNTSLNGSSSIDLPSTSHQNIANSTTVRSEVWFHEDCVIWSNGIYLAGNRVRNIDEVVLECSEIVSLLR